MSVCVQNAEPNKMSREVVLENWHTAKSVVTYIFTTQTAQRLNITNQLNGLLESCGLSGQP